jgi:predicted Zn-ribbon and HTH transcriptional regulator
MDRTPSGPPTRNETVRAALRDRLRSETTLTLRELSQAIGASERDVLAHLEHLERSLSHTDERLIIEPARCLACGFAFEARARFKKPGRCPTCRATRISSPRFSIQNT